MVAIHIAIYYFVELPLSVIKLLFIGALHYPKFVGFILITLLSLIKDSTKIINIYSNIILYISELLSIYIIIIIQSVILIRYLIKYIISEQELIRNILKYLIKFILYCIRIIYRKFIKLFTRIANNFIRIFKTILLILVIYKYLDLFISNPNYVKTTIKSN